jgi:hypothetical membrane protein
LTKRAQLTVAFAVLGLAGAILFPLNCLVSGLREPHFSFVDNATSDLGALTARHALPYNTALSISGVLTIGLALALGRFLPRGRAVIAGAVLVAIFGVGQFIDGLAREDCAVSVNRACRAAADAGRLSTHHKVHDAESIVTFSALLLAPLVLGFVFRSIPSLHHLARWSFAACVAQLVSVTLFLLLYSGDHGGIGVFEIAALASGVAWIATIALVVIRARGALDQPELRPAR